MSQNLDLEQHIEQKRKLLSFTSLPPLLDFALNHVIKLSNMEQGILIVFEQPGNPTVVATLDMDKDELDAPAYESIRTIANRVVLSKKSFYCPHLDKTESNKDR